VKQKEGGNSEKKETKLSKGARVAEDSFTGPGLATVKAGGGARQRNITPTFDQKGNILFFISHHNTTIYGKEIKKKVWGEWSQKVVRLDQQKYFMDQVNTRGPVGTRHNPILRRTSQPTLLGSIRHLKGGSGPRSFWTCVIKKKRGSIKRGSVRERPVPLFKGEATAGEGVPGVKVRGGGKTGSLKGW